MGGWATWDTLLDLYVKRLKWEARQRRKDKRFKGSLSITNPPNGELSEVKG